MRLLAEELFAAEHLEPEQALLRQEALAELTDAIAQLSPLQQDVLRLRFGYGLPCGDIAAILNKKESAVRMLLSRALKALRSVYITP